jgi:hypothetical protein
MPYFVFESGQFLSASVVQENLMDQQVMIFASASVRNAAFTSASSTSASAYPLEGMMTYIGSGSFQYFDGTSWEKWPE